MYNLSPLKDSGIDGFHAKFYQANWDIVGALVCSMVRQILGGELVDPMISRTLLVLLSKVQGRKYWMALKIDMEKAYDKVKWDFWEDTLLGVGLPRFLVPLIMNYVSSASLQIL
ncbi:hypothetical protein J1N35_022873 [Gossypium stocksii]|uniref:Reverse transcriptase domain-containing protein n=1 Tax=Gossypium stocksii TaxID=47602 RepID=A0A9D3VIP6_9ROSI|nr:hypothetical protein J1N35_022873 [Gossypium stocksii]